MKKAKVKKNRVKCTFCKKRTIHNPEIGKVGTNVGNGETLGLAIMRKYYGKRPLRKHPLSRLKRQGYCAQAHHLICSESMDDDKWGRVCKNFGYNINHQNNGIILPADLRIACQKNVPLHKGNHSGTVTDFKKLNYVNAVKRKINSVLEGALQKKYCAKGKDIIARLNSISKNTIWKKVKAFKWTLTYDGKDYKSGSKKGCMGQRGLTKKQKVPPSKAKCKDRSDHDIIISTGKYFEEQK